MRMAKIGAFDIPERTMSFKAWNGVPMLNTFGGKGVVDRGGVPMFAELAIAEVLKVEGYQARWAETYGRGNKPPIFLDRWGERGFKYQTNAPIEDAWVMDKLAEIAQRNGGSYRGCWDVLAWKDGNLLFAESKRKKRDAIKDTQIAWLNAAIASGLSPENFLIVEWDFTDS